MMTELALVFKQQEEKKKEDRLEGIFDLYMAERESRKVPREVPMLNSTPIMDSGAAGSACPEKYAEDVAETTVTGEERTFRSAMGGRQKSSGHRLVFSEAVTNTGRTACVGVQYQVGPVTRPIVSTSQSTRNGKAVWFTEDCSGVCPRENFKFEITGDYIPFTEKNGLYEMAMEPVT